MQCETQPPATERRGFTLPSSVCSAFFTLCKLEKLTPHKQIAYLMERFVRDHAKKNGATYKSTDPEYAFLKEWSE